MLNELPNIPKKRWRRCASGTRNFSHAVPIESAPAVHSILCALFQILMFEPDTKSTENKHTLSPQRRLIITDTDGLVMALG